MKSFDQIEIERLMAEVKALRESLARALHKAESWADEAHGILLEDEYGYDGWAHRARELLQKEGQQ